MQFEALKKSVMGVQARTFKNFNKWKPACKDY